MVVACIARAPTRRVTSAKVNGFVFEEGDDAVCSPGRRRKKKPKMAISAIPISSVEDAVVARC
jgi:hypothetical protein